MLERLSFRLVLHLFIGCLHQPMRKRRVREAARPCRNPCRRGSCRGTPTHDLETSRPLTKGSSLFLTRSGLLGCGARYAALRAALRRVVRLRRSRHKSCQECGVKRPGIEKRELVRPDAPGWDPSVPPPNE